MSKKDKLNHDIDIIKSVIKSILLSFFGICAFAFVNAESLSVTKMIILLLGSIGLLAFGLVMMKVYKKKGRELENE